jgi:NADPH:quinone reductase
MLQRVVRSTILDAPIERVWSVLRDFNSHARWHDVVEQSRIDGGERSDQVGCVRSFTLKDGNHIREQLLTLDDRAFKSTYCIVQATVPLKRYVATITLKPVTDGNRTFWHWESTFSTPPGMETELCDLVANGVYETGFQNLRRYLAEHRDLTATGQGNNVRGATLLSAASVEGRCVQISAYGASDVLRAQAEQVSAPGPGEVRIRQRAIGVNYLDVYLRRGWIPGMLPLPGVLGMEAAGSVMDVGEGVHGWLPGDRVAYMGPLPGAYCSVRCVPADWLLRLPPSVNDDVAAALLLKGVTADYLLRDLGHIGPGTRLLVHAAAGGVGLLLCAWAKHLGAQVIGTVSSDEKARVARDYGCEHVIVTAKYRFADAVQRHCGGVDVLVDGLGEAARNENLAALARRGHWISLGQASGALTPPSADELLAKSLSFSRPVVFDYMATGTERTARAQRVWDALASGVLRPPPIERYTLDAAAQAHERLEQRRSIGPLVLSC